MIYIYFSNIQSWVKILQCRAQIFDMTIITGLIWTLTFAGCFEKNVDDVLDGLK